MTPNQCLYTLLQRAVFDLTCAGCETPRLDAEVIIAHALQQDRSWLVAHREVELSDKVTNHIEALIQRRMHREPVAYITGEREFFKLIFEVNSQVLIPRPETELLLEEALQWAAPYQATSPHPLRVVDVGTGSGCIAVTLAVHLAQAKITATDISAQALIVAKRNAQRHQVTRQIHFHQGDLLTGLEAPVDLIASNPPYIAVAEMATLSPEVAIYEPTIALTDEADGLSIIRRLLAQSLDVMNPGGLLLIEFGAAQGPAVLELAQTQIPKAQFSIKQDLAGRDRLLIGQYI